MKISSFIFSFLFLVLTLSFISSQPPLQQSPTDAGYLIVETAYPETHKANEDYYVHAHVYNGTNGLLVTSDIDCAFHFYNHNLDGGQHIVNDGILTQYGQGYYNTTDGALLNQTGLYSVLIWCNSTTEGGFLKYSFEVTSTGMGYQSIFQNSILLMLLAVSLILIWGSLIIKMPSIGFLGSLALIVGGVYMMIYGLNNVADFYTRTVAGIMIGVGIIFMIIISFEIAQRED